MRLTSKTEYAILALVYLGRKPDGELVHADEIVLAQGIPKQFLQQILYALKQADLVRSVKGKNGGYSLSRTPQKITLAEVVRLFDGPLAPSTSVSLYFYEPTPIEKEKKVVELLKDIRQSVADRLERTTLADVC